MENCAQCGHPRSCHVWPATPEQKNCGKLLHSTDFSASQPCDCPAFVEGTPRGLFCRECKFPNEGPDTGECVLCGSQLIEDESEAKKVGMSGVAQHLVDVVNDGLATAAVARGKASRGRN